jgi:hypothetical protein
MKMPSLDIDQDGCDNNRNISFFEVASEGAAKSQLVIKAPPKTKKLPAPTGI